MGSKATSMVLRVKNVNGYPSLFPKTSTAQINGGLPYETFGPFEYTLKADNWTKSGNDYIQSFTDGNVVNITSDDRPFCVKILEGDSDQMLLQQYNYDMLDPRRGIEAFDGKIQFLSTEKMNIDIKVNVYWTSKQ